MDNYSPSKFLNKINKRNRYYLNDDKQSNDDDKQLTPLSKKRNQEQEQKNKIDILSNRLRTLLKLPKAHRWVIYEWFYSNLDQPLFCYNKPNDFQLCLNDMLPQLKTRNLRRAEWCYIRKLLGKPRRCSSVFLEQERDTLKKKREKLREIYINSSIDNLEDYLDLPSVINLPLIVGSKCTVLFKKTHDGLFNGTINAIDLQNGIYRVSFDKSGFGSENIYDFEVKGLENAESIPLTAFLAKKNRPIPLNNNYNNVKKLYNQQKLNEYLDDQQYQFNQQNDFSIKEEKDDNQFMNEQQLIDTSNSQSLNSDESFVRYMNHCTLNSNSSLIDQQDQQSIKMKEQNDKIIGNYPLKFLALIVNFYKLVEKKSSKLNQLRTMNTQAEFYKSSSKFKLNDEFRNEYATIILELEKIKDNINLKLEQIDKYIKELKLNTFNQTTSKLLKIDQLDELTEFDYLKRNLNNRNLNLNSKNLITNLIGILLMLKNVNELDKNDEFTNLQLKLKQIKQNLNHKNKQIFENNIELHFYSFNYSLDQNRTNSRLDAFYNDHI